MFGLSFIISSNCLLWNNCPSILQLRYQCQSNYLASVFLVEQLYSNNQWLIITASSISVSRTSTLMLRFETWNIDFCLREYRQKVLLCLPDSGCYVGGGGGVGVWVNLLKKEHLWQKSFYQTLLNEVLKIYKKIIPPDVKANKNKK